MINIIEKRLDKKFIPYIIISFLALIVYSNSFTAPFLLDDFSSISNNHAIYNPLDFSEIWKFYSSRFVLYYTISLNYFLHDNAVYGYHIINLAIHILNGVLVYLIFQNVLGLKFFIRKITGRYRNIISLISALIFVSHPIQVNSVTYIIQRTASLAATFYFLAILFFIKYRIFDELRYFIFTMLFTIIAMFTKENTITIPFMLVLIECMFFVNDGKTSWKKRLTFLFILFLTIPVIPSTSIMHKFLGGYNQSDPDITFKASTSMDRFHYFYTQMRVITLYIKLLFIPDNLNFDYSNDFPISHTIWENNSYISLIILSIIGLLGLLNFKRNKLISLGILWFFIGLSVESSFISIKDVYFEHRLYFPLVGFIMFLVGLVFHQYTFMRGKKLIEKPFLLFVVVSATMIFMNSVTTLYRNYIYSDTIRLWSDVVKKASGSDRAHSALGGNYLDAYQNAASKNPENLNHAERELNIAINLNSRNDTAQCNLAKVYFLQNEYEKCIAQAKKANDLSSSEYSYNNMGIAYKKLGKIQEAIYSFLEGYKVNDKCDFIIRNLGDTYFEMGDYKNAKYYYEDLLKKDTRYNDKKAVNDKLAEINKATVK